MTALKPASWLQDFIKNKTLNCFSLGQLELKGHILKYYVSRQWRTGNHLNFRLCFCMESTIFFPTFSKLCFQIPRDVSRSPPPFLRNRITLIVETFFFTRFPHLHWDFWQYRMDLEWREISHKSEGSFASQESMGNWSFTCSSAPSRGLTDKHIHPSCSVVIHTTINIQWRKAKAATFLPLGVL